MEGNLFTLLDGNGVPQGIVHTTLDKAFVTKCWYAYYNELVHKDLITLNISFEAYHLNVPEFAEQMRKHKHDVLAIPYVEINPE